MDKSIYIFSTAYRSTLCLTCPPNDEDAMNVQIHCRARPGEFLSIGYDHPDGEGFSPYCDLTRSQSEALHRWLGECLEKFTQPKEAVNG